MLTPLKLALAAATAVTGGYALNGVFDEPQTKPVPQAEGQWQLASAQDVEVKADDKLDRKVSVHLEGTVAEVVKWLTDQGVSFVISDKELSQKHIMVNMVDQPLKDAVQAIGDALGGRWQKRGEVYVFQSGTSPFMSFNGKGFGDDMKGFIFEPDNLKDLHKLKSFGSDMKGFKLDEKALKEFKELKDLRGFGGDMKAFKFDAKDLKELKELHNLKGLEELKHLPKMDGKAFVWTDEKGKSFSFEMPRMDGKALKWRGEGGKTFTFEMPKMNGDVMVWKDEKGKTHKLDMKKADGKAFVWSGDGMKDFKIDLKKMPELKGWHDDPFTFESADIQKLIKSLTPAQKAKQKKQGYLTPADLSAAQRQMLGGLSKKGNWNISFSQDGQTIKLRNK